MTAATPITLTETESGAQSLATGTVGHALLAVERAVNGTGEWATAQRLIQQAAARVDAALHTGLYYGAPAIAFLLHTTTADGRDRYPAARQALDLRVRRLTRTRLTSATQRLRASRPATFAEYDLFTGLIGFGALLLHQAPDSDELGDLLTYLVRLVEPRYHDDLHVPGWWVEHDPDPLYPTPGGHANLGMAHGAAGLLALLAHATRHGHHVPGQTEAIGWLCGWFDQWRQESPHGPWWPQWITREQLRTGHLTHDGPGRLSWCYGTPGIARALQLAAIATRDRARKTVAEHALAACLISPQRDRFTDLGICHGLAGLYQTAHRAAADTTNPVIARQLPALVDLITHTGHEAEGDDSGFLTGTTGVLLAQETIRAGQTCTRWDVCLLIA
ncbi:lanthionine synthetase C family protein [Actinoplanes sp. NPDC051513]|uniref:lanthionine synthetase C family protein n=1 Tax=Actinoplanes sp. NPDC051513 TaxID=3363908 RepID=UPI0037A08364